MVNKELVRPFELSVTWDSIKSFLYLNSLYLQKNLWLNITKKCIIN
jgi:hypothetical protein